MKKRMIAMMLALACILSLSLTGMAASSQQYRTADALNELDLFRGKGTAGYDLDANLTRAEGATLLVRMLGKDAVAESWTAPIPFKDVPAWAVGYVGYAAANNITNGTNLAKGEFSPNAPLSDYMFLTLVLRALGYSDQGAKPLFVWNDPYQLAAQVGLIGRAAADSNFTRGDAVQVLWNAMSVKLAGKTITLAQNLMAQGVFTKAEFAAAEKIQREGRKENAGRPILRPGSSGSSGNTGSGAVNGPGQLPGTENNNGESDAPSHIIVPGNPNGGQKPSVDKSELPWHNGGKQPSEYTWEEYEALDAEYKDAFFESFEDAYAFLEWQDRVQNIGGSEIELPWENGGKQPKDYTWAEFEALSGEQQMAFQKTFGSADAFAAWEEDARLWADGKPWENGGKAPDTYTWREFQRLNDAQKMAFQSWFGSDDAFADWMEQAQASNVELPWENGGKRPSDYTWAEFNALTGAQQMAFQNWFGGASGFESWMQVAQGGGNAVVLPWENGGKRPDAYTWAEFENLTGDQQMAFQNWFGNNGRDFEDWMRDAQGGSSDNGLPFGKDPDAYTWAEFEALTGDQQMIFQNWFMNNGLSFEDWMYEAMGM